MIMYFLGLLRRNTTQKRATEQQPKGSRIRLMRVGRTGCLWLIILLGIFLIAGLWIFTEKRINEDYDRTIAEASQETMNLAIAFEEDVRRVITAVDQDLSNMKQTYEQGGISSQPFTTVFDYAAKDPNRSLVALFNEQGVVVKDSLPDTIMGNCSDREYFLAHRASDNNLLGVGTPIEGRILGARNIPLTRRINKPDGSFGGIVYIGIKLDYFLSFYRKINLGQDQLIALTGQDGYNRARRSSDNVEGGQDIRGSQFWQTVQSGASGGTFQTTHMVDGIERITSYRVMPDYPLIVSVAKSTQVALANYKQRKFGYVFEASLASLLIMIFCGLLVTRLRQVLRYDSLMSGMPDGFAYCKMIYVNDKPEDLIYIEVNDAFTTLTGLKDVIGKRITAVIPGLKKENPELLEICGRVAKTGISERVEGYYESVDAWLSIAVSSDQKGYFMAIFDNITERKAIDIELQRHRDNLQELVMERTQELESTLWQLQRSNEKLAEQAHILDLACDYIMVCDLDYKIIYWNRGAEIGTGWLANEAIGQVANSLLKTQYLISAEDMIDRLLAEGRWEGERTHTHKDGSQIVVRSYLTLNSDTAGNPKTILEINHDITKQKKMEVDIARLDRLNTVGEMAASIGHEVRNPLTTVRGYLQHYGRKSVFAEYRESFELMIDELDRANSIITEFLSLAKNKSVTMSPTDLRLVIQNLMPLMQADALRRGSNVELEIEDIPEVLADDKEIRQCILNLVNNAMDATLKGGTVIIRTSKVGQRVVLTVQDQGPGIPAEIKNKLGIPFLTTKESGVGLGLAVCYRIAQRHLATIEVETGPGGTGIHLVFNQVKNNE